MPSRVGGIANAHHHHRARNVRAPSDRVFEPGSRVTEAEYAGIVDRFRDAVHGASVVTFNGTVCDKHQDPVPRPDPYRESAGAITILDSHGSEFALGLESVPCMVKPNVAETEELLGCPLNTDDAKWEAVAEFHARGVELVALSWRRGAFVSRGAERFHVVPPRITEVNPVGSGDVFVAGFAIGLLEHMPLRDMAVLACAAGAANAMTWDIGHFRKDEVDS